MKTYTRIIKFPDKFIEQNADVQDAYLQVDDQGFWDELIDENANVQAAYLQGFEEMEAGYGV